MQKWKCELKEVLQDLITNVQNRNLHSVFFTPSHYVSRNPCSHRAVIPPSFWWVSLTAEYTVQWDVRRCPFSKSLCGLEHLLLVCVCTAVLWERSLKCCLKSWQRRNNGLNEGIVRQEENGGGYECKCLQRASILDSFNSMISFAHHR